MATIICAGFASGQEIMQFTGYYEGGFYGIVLAGILFSIIGMLFWIRCTVREYEIMKSSFFPQ